jgi:hypothetical protein
MRIVSVLLATILLLAPTPVWARTLGERRAAAWLSVAHPGLGEY